jgi:citrate lyase subunit beta/citryl-CoA lyase
MDKVGISGTEGKADCRVEISLDSRELLFTLTSKVERLYGNTIRRNIRALMEKYGVKKGSITVNDQGAYDFVIAARIESALLKAGFSVEDERIDEGKEREISLRRTRLYLPGNNPKLLYDGTIFDCDCVILDLEDSVPLNEKTDARVLVRNALHNLQYSQERMVRINPLPLGEADVKEILKTKIDTILIPKVESREELNAVVAVIEKYESRYKKKKKVRLIPIIETALGLENASEIAGHERVVALTFGAEDYLADIGGQRNDDSLFYLRAGILNAAKAWKKQALDTVFPDVNDDDGLEKETRLIKGMGYDGKGIIHPRQAGVIHRVFTPSVEEYEKAKKIVDTFEAAKGKVVAVNGRMVDLPVVKRAQKIVDLYEGR